MLRITGSVLQKAVLKKGIIFFFFLLNPKSEREPAGFYLSSPKLSLKSPSVSEPGTATPPKVQDRASPGCGTKLVH